MAANHKLRADNKTLAPDSKSCYYHYYHLPHQHCIYFYCNVVLLLDLYVFLWPSFQWRIQDLSDGVQICSWPIRIVVARFVLSGCALPSITSNSESHLFDFIANCVPLLVQYMYKQIYLCVIFLNFVCASRARALLLFLNEL